MPGDAAAVRTPSRRSLLVRIGAADIGTGARTVLTQIAADALGVRSSACDARDRRHRAARRRRSPAARSGTSHWGSAISLAARAFRAEHGDAPEAGATAEATTEPPGEQEYATHSFGAQFAEARVNVDTGEVRVPRLLGVFAVGRIVNPRTARSQLIGGMTMGLSMALHEESRDRPRSSATTPTTTSPSTTSPSHADVQELDAVWIDEEDFHVNAMGAKGIGEIGITGTAAAIANAVHHATGVRRARSADPAGSRARRPVWNRT